MHSPLLLHYAPLINTLSGIALRSISPKTIHSCFPECLVSSSGAGKGENPEGLGRNAIGPSRFWVKGNKVPEQNADAAKLLPYYQYLPHRFDQPQRWTPQDCNKLQEHVLGIVKVFPSIV